MKGETHEYVFLAGGVIVMGLGAAVVARANTIIPSDSSKTTADGVNVSDIKYMKNIGIVFILVGLAMMGWYGWNIFGLYGGKEKAAAAYEQAKRQIGEYRTRRAESSGSTTTASTGAL